MLAELGWFRYSNRISLLIFSLITLFCDAFVSTCLLRYANFKVLCVSSVLLEAGVTVQMSFRNIQKSESVLTFFSPSFAGVKWGQGSIHATQAQRRRFENIVNR